MEVCLMFVNQASFEGDKANEAKIIAKMKKTFAELQDVSGLLSSECWKKEKNDVVEYSIVTKWTAKQDFIAWLSREEHVNEHKEMNKQRKQGISEKPSMKKTITQYEEIEIANL